VPTDKSLLFIARRVLAPGFFAFICAFPPPALGDDPPSVLLEGEVLTYNVRYGPFDLGQVKIRTLGRVPSLGSAYAARADINSYPKVPLVDLHAIFESQIDTVIASHWFNGKLKSEDHWDFSRYRYDYPHHKVYLEMGRSDTIVAQRDTISITGTCQDGLSLFFYAREHLQSGKIVNVPAVVKEKLVNTYLDFTWHEESVEVDACKYPVKALHFSGTLQFTGLFGLTGDFEGWFSNDDARVPIMAKLKVLLGSVTVELMEWKRGTWTPPRATE
jgi:hypothetical protein